MAIPKVNRGDSIRSAMTAETWNAFVDAANYHKIRSQPSTVSVSSGDEWPASTVLVKNDTGAALALGAIVGIGAPIILPTANLEVFKTRIGFLGVTPTSAHHGKFAVLRESIPSGQIGIGAIAGIVPVQITTSQTWITRCDITPSNTSILTAKPEGSAQILWSEGITGTQYAIVRLGCAKDVSVVGKVTADATPGSTNNTVSLWNAGSPAIYQISGVRFDWMTGNQKISANKEVLVNWFSEERVWRITGAECET